MRNDRKKTVEGVIQWAIDNGWNPLELLTDKVTMHLDQMRWHLTGDRVVIKYRESYFSHHGKTLAKGGWHHIFDQREFGLTEVLFNKSFARYLWGDEDVNYYGEGLTAIRIKFAQTAVEIGEKLYAADRSRAEYSFLESFPRHGTTPIQAVVEPLEVHKVTRKLEDMWQTVPVRTHQFQSLEWSGTEPAYQHHLKRMVEADDLVKYLATNVPKYAPRP